ncbi:MAG: hypothetical protein GY915_00260, partial [bacterium]|nr:hypothetical protein [bacterium]
MSSDFEKQRPWLLYHGASQTLTFGGNWDSKNLPLLSKHIQNLKNTEAKNALHVDWKQVSTVDLNGALMIWKTLELIWPEKSEEA